jgi:hypothetical protein
MLRQTGFVAPDATNATRLGRILGLAAMIARHGLERIGGDGRRLRIAERDISGEERRGGGCASR